MRKEIKEKELQKEVQKTELEEAFVLWRNEANLRIKEVADSYITKEKFIQMIQTLDFKYIESSRLHFVTGFKYEEEKDIVKTIGYDISID